ncbi:MAG: pyridoxamine 5'-phosphate oxidase family protein [Bacillota bacterium]|nr:pyridoxamine 5'-phosphate oxidase family protein [Bacillota bacterium]
MRRRDREVTNIEEIRKIIDKCKVCNLAMVDKGTPYVIPLNFGYTIEGDMLTLYFHSAKEGRKIDILKENNSVCFSMMVEGMLGHIENPCNSGYYFESVIGFGKVEFITDVDEKCKILSNIVKHQSNQDFSFTQKHTDSIAIYKVTTNDFVGKIKPNPKQM